MKKVLLACVIAGAMSVSSAFALTSVKFSDGPGDTGGGEFRADVGNDGSIDFITFCLEYNEHIAYNTVYYFGVSDAAKYQGLSAGSPGSLDPISKATAWLYLQALNGGLGYTHTTAAANLMQRAIWFFEGESGGSGQTAANNSYVAAAITANGGTLAAAQADNGGFYGVGVMNLWANADGTGARQDQLIRVPDGGTTLVFLGMAMTGLAAANRRFRKA